VSNCDDANKLAENGFATDEAMEDSAYGAERVRDAIAETGLGAYVKNLFDDVAARQRSTAYEASALGFNIVLRHG
jgi:hypothetical protein